MRTLCFLVPALAGCALDAQSTTVSSLSEDYAIARAFGKAVLGDGRIVTLHLSRPDDVGWASLERGAPGDQVWLDRSPDPNAGWDPQLGLATVPTDEAAVQTGVFIVNGQQLRACGRAVSAPEIACTAWLPAVDVLADGADPEGTPERPVSDIPLAHVWNRQIELHIADARNAVWASIEGASQGDEVWLDRDWDANQDPWNPTVPDSGWDGQLGYTTVPFGHAGWRTLMFTFDDHPRGGHGLVRACGKAGDQPRIECTPWVRPGDHRGDPRVGAIDTLLNGWLTTPNTFEWTGWVTHKGPLPEWWQSGKAITALIDTMARDQSCDLLWVIDGAFESSRDALQVAHAQHPYPDPDRFENRYYDDTGWWALAWIRAFEWSAGGTCGISQARRMEFLQVADHAWSYMKAGKLVADDSPNCFNLIEWTNRTQLNCDADGMHCEDHRLHLLAIPSLLYLELTAKLYSAWTTVIPASLVQSVRDEAVAYWDLVRSRLVLRDGLITDSLGDGFDHYCSTYDAWPELVFTSNYGVLIAGLSALARATNNSAYLEEAERYADDIIRERVTRFGGIVEEDHPLDWVDECDTADDAYGTKGIFVRGLRELVDTDTARGRDALRFADVIRAQPAAITAHARTGWNGFSYEWDGLVRNSCQVGVGTATSALDAFNAARGL